jgi:hypothetical protein
VGDDGSPLCVQPEPTISLPPSPPIFRSRRNDPTLGDQLEKARTEAADAIEQFESFRRTGPKWRRTSAWLVRVRLAFALGTNDVVLYLLPLARV